MIKEILAVVIVIWFEFDRFLYCLVKSVKNSIVMLF